ncbi:CHAT domain-containing protein, partial [Myxococcota bacterium]|nr:CHAT domain-containing protein [Myxococcota bacterium]
MIPYRATLTLSAVSDPTQIHALLRDPNGASGGGLLHFDPSALVPKLDRSWEEALHDLALDKLTSPEQELLGAALFQLLTAPRPIGEAWAAIRAAAGGAPLHLTVELPPDHPVTETLPWELLRDGQGHLFHVLGSALTRTYTGLPTRSVQLSARPRVLLLWACPTGTTRFDPSPHVERLRAIFGDRLDVIQRGSEQALAQHLKAAREAADPYEVLHILAHGYATPIGDTLDRGVIFDGPMGKENVPGDRLAALLRGHGLRLVFLCSCQGGVVAEGLLGFTGTAQRLLSPAGASVPVVVASQANLPIPGSAALAEQFYRALPQDRGDPALALARARHWAYGNGTAWATPILMRCPAPAHDPGLGPAHDLGQLDGPRPTFRQRPEVLTEGLAALQSSRLVSVVGLPGIGKTEIGKEIARQAHARQAHASGGVDRVLYLEAHRGLDGEALRVKLGGFLGLHEPPKNDEALAAAMERDPSRLLLVLDNAEDMMPDAARQAAFKAQLGAWLRVATRLRVLLTTRWLVSASTLGERRVDVPPLPRAEMDRLLQDELTARGALREGEPGSADWEELLDLLDGHPRSLILVAPQLAEPGMTLPEVVRRLQRFKVTAYADSDLIGQEDAWDGLEPSEQARMRSLVASMDLSWSTLTGRYPTAALAYRELSLFPSGLPDEVARLVTQDEETLSLKRLTDLSLVERRAGRTFAPVPLQWYAERKRRDEPVDEEAVFRRAVEGFVGFVGACDAALVGGDTSAQGHFFTERANLSLLVNRAPRPQAPGLAPLARLARRARNLLMMLDQLTLWEALASRGLDDARAVGDQAGEANTLGTLGDVYVRKYRLVPAEDAYAQALQLYKRLEDSRGEAN